MGRADSGAGVHGGLRRLVRPSFDPSYRSVVSGLRGPAPGRTGLEPRRLHWMVSAVSRPGGAVLAVEATCASSLITDWMAGVGGAEGYILGVRDGLRAAGDEVALLTSSAGSAGDGTAEYRANGTDRDRGPGGAPDW